MKSENDTIDFENSIAPWMGKTVKVVDYFLQESLKENSLDLTKEQMIVLKKLHGEDGLNQNELAFLTLRNKSSLTRLLVKMEKKGYIKRIQSTTDKRNNNVFITANGKALFQKTMPVIKNLIHTVEKGISREEKTQLTTILKKIQENLHVTSTHL